MKDRKRTTKPERLVARVTVAADARFLPSVVDFVKRTTHERGLRGKIAECLDQAVEVVCQNVVENAFGPDEDSWYDVYVLRRPGQVVVAVEDQGMPGDYASLESGEDSLCGVCYTARLLTKPIS